MEIEGAELHGIRRAIFECSNCGMPTAACRNPRCTKMACASNEISHQFCATHRGEISSFEAQSALIADPCDFPKLFERSDGDVDFRASIKRAALLAGSLAIILPLAKLSATTAGGIYGSRVLGLSGAAARSAGLAKFGGGALIAGGKGVAGGVSRVKSLVVALNSARNWQVSNAYFADLVDDLSIDRLREGHDPAVICIDGFLTQSDEDADVEASNEAWLSGLGAHYTGHAVYRIRWPSQHKRNAATGAVKAATGAIVPSVFAAAVSKASLAAATTLRSRPAALAGLAAATAANPWSVALSNSKKTGFLLAEMLSRCDRRSFILIGHSLGARACVFALRRLAKRRATSANSFVVDVHLMGGAIDARDASFWLPVANAITGRLHNYYTTNDQVLQYAYRVGALSFRGSAIGRCAIPTDQTTAHKIASHDVGPHGVNGHREYHRNMRHFLIS